MLDEKQLRTNGLYEGEDEVMLRSIGEDIDPCISGLCLVGLRMGYVILERLRELKAGSG